MENLWLLACRRSGARYSLLATTFSLWSRDGLRLFAREWLPSSGHRGTLCVLHGHGEHGGRHDVLAWELVQAGYAVMALDLRGHGRSEGKRGHTPSYEHLLDDTESLLQHAVHRFPEQPCFLCGHSFGGNIALNYALRRPGSHAAGIIATSPWLRLTHEISTLRVVLASIVDPLWPSFCVSTSVDRPKLKLGPLAKGIVEFDPLHHDRVSMRAFLSTRRAGRWAIQQASLLTIPALVLHGELDDVADAAASMEFAAGANGLCQYRVLQGQYHNLHMAPQPETYIGLMQEWLDAQVAQHATGR